MKSNGEGLRVDWATHEAAVHAVTRWHYSGVMPTGKLVKIGAWEGKKFIGVVVFSRGASPHLQTKFGMSAMEVCELTRVALRKHQTPVTRIVRFAFKLLKEKCPGLRLVVSFADPEQGHDGAIYRAGNWLYSGCSGDTVEYLIGGRWRHVRGAYHMVKNSTEEIPKRTRRGKYRYLMPLDDETRERVAEHVVPFEVADSASEA